MPDEAFLESHASSGANVHQHCVCALAESWHLTVMVIASVWDPFLLVINSLIAAVIKEYIPVARVFTVASYK